VVDIMGFDAKRDLVLLHIDAKGLSTLALDEGDGARPGDPVVAIGHPLGLADTVSDGLVSAVRIIDDDLTVLQISAPIAPGSSGGPLFNQRGEVIGVAAAVARQGQNLNFAIPVSYVRALIAKAAPMSMEAFVAQLRGVAPDLPQVRRQVPVHDVSVLRGCSDDDLRLVGASIQRAIEVGAPLYNDGNFAACYHVYEGASLDVDRKLPLSCRGPKKALDAGRRKAAQLKDASAQAWAMRDAFDGLLSVIIRRVTE
jgi:hypothetical protein